MSDIETVQKIAEALAPHMRDKESTAGCINFFESLFRIKLNCPYQVGEMVEYFSRGSDRSKPPRWLPARVTKALHYGDWNDNTPMELEVILLDEFLGMYVDRSPRIVRKDVFDVRLRKLT
jgi:hypothetical protein